MSNSGKFFDKTPFLSQAGYTSAIEGLSADNSIRQDLFLKIKTATPERIKKYRNSIRERVGVKQLHPGIYDDDKHYESLVHGIKTLGSDHVNDCIKIKNDSGVSHFMNEIKESYYSSNNREPIGMGLKRNYVFPEKITSDKNFKFGMHSTGCMSVNYLILLFSLQC